jgi:hypothetical protein
LALITFRKVSLNEGAQIRRQSIITTSIKVRPNFVTFIHIAIPLRPQCPCAPLLSLVLEYGCNAWRNLARPRASRDITVPIGASVIWAISA